MAQPSTSQASHMAGADCAKASRARPAANSKLENASTPRPPSVSMVGPTRGPSTAETSNAAEKAAKTEVEETPRSRAIGSARMAAS